MSCEPAALCNDPTYAIQEVQKIGFQVWRIVRKLAQRATVMALEAVYEQDFLPCSYGFRPGRSAHQALQSLHTAVMSQELRWVIDIDIVKYFDSIPHSHLRDFLDRRVTDGVI
jgi:RNA-directed DNA polymerase